MTTYRNGDKSGGFVLIWHRGFWGMGKKEREGCGKAKHWAQSHILSGRLALKPGNTSETLSPTPQYSHQIHHCMLYTLQSYLGLLALATIIIITPKNQFKCPIMQNHLWVPLAYPLPPLHVLASLWSLSYRHVVASGNETSINDNNFAHHL